MKNAVVNGLRSLFGKHQPSTPAKPIAERPATKRRRKLRKEWPSVCAYLESHGPASTGEICRNVLGMRTSSGAVTAIMRSHPRTVRQVDRKWTLIKKRRQDSPGEKEDFCNKTGHCPLVLNAEKEEKAWATRCREAEGALSEGVSQERQAWVQRWNSREEEHRGEKAAQIKTIGELRQSVLKLSKRAERAEGRLKELYLAVPGEH